MCRIVNLEAFHQLFGESIRSWLAWGELETSDAQIRQQVIANRMELGRLLTVWYADPAGKPGDWRDPAHSPMTAAQAAQARTSWKNGAAERIEDFRSQFLESAEPPVLVLPAFVIKERILLLDGTHRALALFNSGLDPRVLICAVVGPAHARVLPDLERWSSILD